MNKKNISISEPYFDKKELLSLKDSFSSGWITQGPKVTKFEKLFASFHKSKYAVALNSCTSGLHLMLHASGIKKGDEVIVPSFTWISTANAVLYTGAKPIFIDIDKFSYNINITDILDKITSKTKAIIVVHLFGLCVDVKKIKKIIPKKIMIFEDCACASGAKINNSFAGTFGEAGVFSFHPRKSITTGEGGMLITNNSKLAKKIMELRNHGAEISDYDRHHKKKPYELPDFKSLGFNYRMTDLQASIGIVQLKKLKKIINEREKFAKIYKKYLKKIPWIELPIFPKSGNHGWQAFVIRIKKNISPFKRNKIMQKLQKKGIATRPGTHAIHMLSYYKRLFNFKPDDFPVSKDCYENTIAIPLHNKMTTNDYKYVIDQIKKINN